MDFVDIIIEYLPIFMFLTMGVLLFIGYPVGFILGGVAITYGFIGYLFGVFKIAEFFNFVPRMWGFSAENLILVAIPSFVFMGTMMERSGIANDLLRTTQILLRKVPGGLAMSVTVMGTVLAAMTGIIGASVTMMTALALPTMLKNKYSHALSTGVIAASGTPSKYGFYNYCTISNSCSLITSNCNYRKQAISKSMFKNNYFFFYTFCPSCFNKI